MNLDNIGVTKKPPKVKAFDSCEGLLPADESGEKFQLVGTVTRGEAQLLENVLRLYRREAGTLTSDELQLVASVLMLKGVI